MINICFNLFDAHSVIFPKDKFAFGGAEVRGVTIASQLAKTQQVSIVIKEHKKRIDTVVDKLRIISHSYYSPFGISFFKRLYYSLIYVLKFKNLISKDQYYKWLPYITINADYYAAFEITATTKSLVDFCTTFNKKFILFVASDGELSYDLELAKAMNVDKNLAKYIVENSFRVFVQNQYQLNKLAENFKIAGVQINNPLPLNIEKLNFKSSDKKYITWIGKSNMVKQPLVFVELAKQFPNEDFFMVMNKNDDALYREVVNLLPANIVFKESLPFLEINELLNNSKLFVNTSLYEGFPNTFLQAGYFSVPVISLNVNPNDFIYESKGGTYCSGKKDELMSAVKNLDIKSSEYIEMAKNIHSYIMNHHSIEFVISKILANINKSLN